jgi:hypothetical protein
MRRIASTSLALALGLSIAAVALSQATQTSAGAGTTSSAAPGTTSSAPPPAATATATPAPTIADVPVTVTLLRDSSGKPIGIAGASPDPVELQLKKQRAVWTLDTADDVELIIKMHGTSLAPFKKAPTHPTGKKKQMVSEAPTDDTTVGKSYKYVITVKFPDGHKLSLDPIIKVTP